MPKRLYRTLNDKVIAGVCGGIAKHLDVDPVLVRLIYILLTFATGLGPGLIVYIIAWVVIPAEPEITFSTPVEPEPAHDTSAV